MFNFAYNILSISNSNISMHHPDLDRVRPKTVKWTDILTILLHKKRHVKRGHTSTVNNTFFQNWLSSQLKNIRIWVLFVFPKSNFRDYLYRYNLYRIKTYGSNLQQLNYFCVPSWLCFGWKRKPGPYSP